MKRLVSVGLALMLLAAAAPAAAASTNTSIAPPPYRVFVVDNIFNRYNGTYGLQSTGHGCYGPCSTSISESYGWSNSWGASISFTKAPIAAAVNYNVSASGSLTFTSTFSVPSGYTGVIEYRDWYHVQQMNVHSYWQAIGYRYGYVYGTAWAQQWYQRIYYLVLS